MVTTQIRLWTFNDVAGTLEPLAPLDQVKAENKLEDALVTSLMSSLISCLWLPAS